MPTATHPHFPDLTVDTAPAAARATLEGVQAKFGGSLPPAVARMAGSPELLATFLTASSAFEGSSLTPLQRETLIMTVAVRNGCHVCIELHTGAMRRLRADPDLVAALRTGAPVPDAGLAALQRFTHEVMDTAGGVSAGALSTFLAAGFDSRHALDVVLGVGTYTLSTFANRMTGA